MAVWEKTRAIGVYKLRGKRGEAYAIRYANLLGKWQQETVGPSYSEAVRLRQQRLAEVRAGKHGMWKTTKVTFREYVTGEQYWKKLAVGLDRSTLDNYDKMLHNYLLPKFGSMPLAAIERDHARTLIRDLSHTVRRTRYGKLDKHNVTLSTKTIQNIIALLSRILQTALVEYRLIPYNPLQGILETRSFPKDPFKYRRSRPAILEPADFVRAVSHISSHHGFIQNMVLVSALAGLRWEEMIALTAEDVDLRTNNIRVTHALYRRAEKQPKEGQSSVGDVQMTPIVRKILERLVRERPTGYLFAKDPAYPLGQGTWVKEQWKKAQRRAGVPKPIRWHDLRHEFCSLLIKAGKPVQYVSKQARHHSAGFTLDTYVHLFENYTPTPVEWIDDLLPRLRAWFDERKATGEGRALEPKRAINLRYGSSGNRSSRDVESREVPRGNAVNSKALVVIGGQE